MRLIGLYATQALSFCRITVFVPKVFINIANDVFGERLIIRTGKAPKNALIYTSLGVKDLVKPIFSGKKFISPYSKAVILDKKKKDIKDFLNMWMYNLSDIIGIIQVPTEESIPLYQGFLEINAIKKFRQISFAEFKKQLETDSGDLRKKLLRKLPISGQLEIPSKIAESVLIFPTGTGRQYMPRWWALKQIPNAVYAFFYKDHAAKIFEDKGLKTVYFYEEPGDIIALAKSAAWVISTDSFPSHLLQYAFTNCTIIITEVLSSRIVSPVFKGKIAEAVAPCHPCLHLDRDNHPLCAAGYKECINWKSDSYAHNLLSTIPVTTLT